MCKNTITLLTIMLYADQAYAYVGPGLGLGAIGAILGVIVTVLLAVVGLLWYPVKRIFKAKSSQNNDE